MSGQYCDGCGYSWVKSECECQPNEGTLQAIKRIQEQMKTPYETPKSVKLAFFFVGIFELIVFSFAFSVICGIAYTIYRIVTKS